MFGERLATLVSRVRVEVPPSNARRRTTVRSVPYGSSTVHDLYIKITIVPVLYSDSTCTCPPTALPVLIYIDYMYNRTQAGWGSLRYFLCGLTHLP